MVRVRPAMPPPIMAMERGDCEAVMIEEGEEVRCYLLLETGDLGLMGWRVRYEWMKLTRVDARRCDAIPAYASHGGAALNTGMPRPWYDHGRMSAALCATNRTWNDIFGLIPRILCFAESCRCG